MEAVEAVVGIEAAAIKEVFRVIDDTGGEVESGSVGGGALQQSDETHRLGVKLLQFIQECPGGGAGVADVVEYDDVAVREVRQVAVVPDEGALSGAMIGMQFNEEDLIREVEAVQEMDGKPYAAVHDDDKNNILINDPALL